MLPTLLNMLEHIANPIKYNGADCQPYYVYWSIFPTLLNILEHIAKPYIIYWSLLPTLLNIVEHIANPIQYN